MESSTAWRKGPWTPEEDKLLIQYITHNGEGRWSCVSKFTGLKRSGKSCRLRWVNYLRPGLKKGHFTPQEEGIIIELHALWGNKWSTIARCLPGRTDNEIKNYWRTHFKPIRKPSQNRRKILETDHQGKTIINEPFQLAYDHHQENINKEPQITFENHHQFLPMVNEQITASDVIPFDCYLWGGLWNLDADDDPKRFAVDQNQSNGVSNCYYSFEAEAVDYVQGGGFIF